MEADFAEPRKSHIQDFQQIQRLLPGLVLLTPLETALSTLLSIIQSQDALLAQHAESLKRVDTLESTIAHLTGRLSMQETLLTQRKVEMEELRTHLKLSQSAENALGKRLDAIESALSAAQANASIQERGLRTVQSALDGTNKMMQLVLDEQKKALETVTSIQDRQEKSKEGQMLERIIRIERELEKKVDQQRLAKEFDVRDQLRRQMAEAHDEIGRRLGSLDQKIELLSQEAARKVDMAGLQRLECEMQLLATKDDVQNVCGELDIWKQEMNASIGAIDRAKVDASVVGFLEGKVDGVDVNVRTLKEEYAHIQEMLIKLTSALSNFATEAKLHVLAKTVRELEKRTHNLDIAQINERLDEKADKVTVLQLKEAVSTLVIDETNVGSVSRVHYRCLSCDRLSYGKDTHICKAETDPPNINITAIFESSISAKQFSIIGADGKLYRGRELNGAMETDQGLLQSTPTTQAQISSRIPQLPLTNPKISPVRPSSAAGTRARPLSTPPVPFRPANS